MFVLQPMRYQTTVMLNVTRKATQQTSDYRYDEFYRLQADERFADTVVRWLGSPNVTDDIVKESKIDPKKLVSNFKAMRLSSQMIQVTVVTVDASSGKKMAQAMRKVIDAQTEKLDEEQKGETWFKVLASDPLVMPQKMGMKIVLFVSIMLGIFLGSWGVLIRHYFKKRS